MSAASHASTVACFAQNTCAYYMYSCSHNSTMFRHLLCACQGLVSVVVGMMILSARLVVSAFMAQRIKSGHTPATEDHPARQPKLVQSCFLAYMLPVGLARTHSLTHSLTHPPTPPPPPTPQPKKKTKNYAFLRQFNEKPSSIPGCPGPTHPLTHPPTHLLTHSLCHSVSVPAYACINYCCI